MGKYNNADINARLCKLYNDVLIQNEYHFMFECKLYDLKRVRFVLMLDICNGNEKTKW